MERNISEYFSTPLLNISTILILKSENDYAIENAKREIQIRVKQSQFREQVLNNFQYRCCLTGIDENDLLVASHIIPWSIKIATRLSPHNGLCLSVLYDRLFDKGYFTLDENNRVIVTSKIALLAQQTQKWLKEILGKKINGPFKHQIDKAALEYHRANIFECF